jgi:hypothetical protein
MAAGEFDCCGDVRTLILLNAKSTSGRAKRVDSSVSYCLKFKSVGRINFAITQKTQ